MPSYLGSYKKAAKDRDNKIVRAIQTVRNQTYEDWELIIIADGCNRTVEIVQRIVDICQDDRIKLLYIDKQTTWSGTVRNTGLTNARGEYACYLDIDDVFQRDHLLELSAFSGREWYWFDDYVWNGHEFRWRKCNIDKTGKCGTSNVMHKPGLAKWKPKGSYAHDWVFIGELKKASKDYEYVKAGKYCVCHVPGGFDI